MILHKHPVLSEEEDRTQRGDEPGNVRHEPESPPEPAFRYR